MILHMARIEPSLPTTEALQPVRGLTKVSDASGHNGKKSERNANSRENPLAKWKVGDIEWLLYWDI